MELEEFVEKYSVEFDCINEGGWMENEFTPEEVLEAIKNAAKNAAQGPTSHTPSVLPGPESLTPLLQPKNTAISEGNSAIFVLKIPLLFRYFSATIYCLIICQIFYTPNGHDFQKRSLVKGTRKRVFRLLVF
jgi:hypothetical protein